jgi:hypothetical protein
MMTNHDTTAGRSASNWLSDDLLDLKQLLGVIPAG